MSQTVDDVAPPSADDEQDPGHQWPQDVQAEQCVLGAMMMSRDAIADVLPLLKGPEFYRAQHRTIYEAVLALYGEGVGVDPVTVAGALSRGGSLSRVGGPAYLHTVYALVPTASNAAYYADRVRDLAIKRKTAQACQKGYHQAMHEEGTGLEVLDRVENSLADVRPDDSATDYLDLGALYEPTVQEVADIAALGGKARGVPTGFVDLDELTNGLHGGQLILIAARPAVGKALALDTPLVTPTGWTTMGEVQVGDYVMGADGAPTRVVAATDVMTTRPCYEVRFSDGTTIVADADHQWLTDTRASRKSEQAAAVGYHGYRSQRIFAAVRTTKEIAETLYCNTADKRFNHTVRGAAPLRLRDADLPVDPYLLGVWLGDGTTAAAQITSADPQIPAGIAARGYAVSASKSAKYRYHVTLPALPPLPKQECRQCGGMFVPECPGRVVCSQACAWRTPKDQKMTPGYICRGCGGRSTGAPLCADCHSKWSVQAQLRDLGVLGNKHIPMIYLRASEAQRRDLLAGLLDTDGTANTSGTVGLDLTNKRLAHEAWELIHSLGYRATMRTRRVAGRTEETSTCWRITFTPTDQVFRLPRKQDRLRHGGVPRRGARNITSVIPVESVPVRCIQVEADDSLYLAGRSMIPTHNSTLAMDFARHAAIREAVPTLFFSLEMSRVDLTMRLLAAEARVPLHHMLTGTMTDDDWQRLAAVRERVTVAPMAIDDSPNISMPEIRAKARRYKQRHGLGFVVLDYLQLMQGSRRDGNRQQEVSEFSRSLKLLAKELDVPIVALSQLNRGPEQRSDKKPMMSDLRESGCLTGETTLLRADTGAPVTFDALLRDGWDGVKVWAVEDGAMVARPLTNVFRSGTKKVHRMRLGSGRAVNATGSHRFLTWRGWVPLRDLRPGDRIAVPRSIPAAQAGPLGWSEDRLALLAYLIADGTVLPRHVTQIVDDDPDVLSTAVRAAAGEFAIEARLDPGIASRCPIVYLASSQALTHGRRNPIHQWFHDLGIYGLRSHEKRLPDCLYQASDTEIGTFLRHLIATDGHIGARARTVRFDTSSRTLAAGIQTLLTRLGIASRLRRVPQAGGRDQYPVDVSGIGAIRRFADLVGAHGRAAGYLSDLLAQTSGIRANSNVDTLPRDAWDDVRAQRTQLGISERRFQASIGTAYCGSTLYKATMGRERAMRVADALDYPALRASASDDLFWDEVVAVEPGDTVSVYDATVEGAHNFVADGIIAHNSLEQDADMVLLLHREDMYEKESPRAGEADIIVAKHRNGPTATITVAHQGHYSRFVNMQQ